MRRLAILSLLLASATFSRAEDNLRQQLWDQVGVELKKPLFCKCVEVTNVREESLAQKLGMQKGDRWFEDAEWVEVSASSTTLLRDDEFAQQVGMSNEDGSISPVIVLGGGNGLLQKFSVKKVRVLEKTLLKVATHRSDKSSGSLQLLRQRNSKKKNYSLINGQVFNGVGLKIQSLDADSGVSVKEVLPGLPAEQSGLQAEDLILSVNGNLVRNSAEFCDIVRLQPPGTVVSIKVQRGEKHIDFLVKTMIMKVDPEGLIDATDDQ